MNIAHFIGSLHIGGAENQVTLIVNSLAEKGHNCHVIVMRDETGYKNLLSEGIGYFNIAYRTRYAPAGLYRLYKYLVKNKIDVLHCHMYHAVSKGAWLGRLAGVPVIVNSEHGKNTWKKWYHHLIEKYLVNKCIDMRIAVSEDIRNIRICNDGVSPDKIIVLPNSVNTDVKIKDNSQQPGIIGSLGRLVDAKDFGNLIRSVKILVEKGRDIKLIIAGEGGERNKLETLIADLGLSEIVELPGTLQSDVFFSSIDIFVMSSRREGVPVSLLEAMAHGLPIATTAVGGIPEIIENEQDGLLCKKSDPEALSGLIARLLDNTALRVQLGKMANMKVVGRFSTESVVNQWIELYGTLYYSKR